VLREGRLTPAQARAIDELSGRFGAPATDAPLDFPQLFGRHAPVHVEIGCGNGDCILALAQSHPDNDYLGIEVHRPGVGSLMLRAEELGLGNLRILHHDAVEAIERQIPAQSVDCIYVFFADPWPKKRHHKRRLLQPSMLGMLRERLHRHGRLFIATDWQDYADHIESALREVDGLCNLAAPARYAPRPAWRPRTRYERRGERLGHVVRDFMLGRM
jgi:tRNA (guanine-N7-)-methyltransferase